MLKNMLLSTVALIAMGASATSTFAQDIKELRIGLNSGENEADRLRNYQCLADHLKETFGFEKVSLFPAADYDGIIQGILGGTIDLTAGMGASGYAAIYLENPDVATPILTTQQTDGSTGYYSIGLARKDLGLTKITDFKGKKLGYADPDSTSGYLVPLTQIPKDTGAPNDEFFSVAQFNGGHENNLLAAKDGVVDVAVDDASGIGDFQDGFTSGTFRKLVDKGTVDPNDMVEVWRSPLIPNGPILVRNALGADMIKKLTDFYMALPASDPACFAAIEGGDFKGYAPVDASFYQAVIDIRKATIGG